MLHPNFLNTPKLSQYEISRFLIGQQIEHSQWLLSVSTSDAGIVTKRLWVLTGALAAVDQSLIIASRNQTCVHGQSKINPLMWTHLIVHNHFDNHQRKSLKNLLHQQKISRNWLYIDSGQSYDKNGFMNVDYWFENDLKQPENFLQFKFTPTELFS